ncbi:MAG: DUF551 domain-containing protein [Oscillospiraceae bacterium]|nr:DUF551 domain-containing protein [Oscillospiraceae bacterium]
MPDRKNLIKLIHYCTSCEECRDEDIADHLIANGVTVQKWIPVTERLPDKMGKYICQYVFGENTEYPFYQVLWYFTAVEKPHFQHEGSMGLRVTHWMPLPEPPKGE